MLSTLMEWTTQYTRTMYAQEQRKHVHSQEPAQSVAPWLAASPVTDQ